MKEFLVNNALVILLGFGTVFNFYWLYRHKKLLRLTKFSAAALALLHTLAGVGAVKVFAVLEKMDLGVLGSMSVFGCVFFLPLLYYAGAKIFRRSVAATFDTFTPCMVMSIMFARINCIISGCCLGKYIPGMAPTRWPTRETELVFYTILLLWIIRGDRKDRLPGLLYPTYMISYGALRFVVEFFRVSDNVLGVFHLSHLWAVLCFGLGLSIYMELKKNNKEKWKK